MRYQSDGTNGHLVLGKNQANFTPSLIKNIGVSLTESYFKPHAAETKGENYICFFAEGLTKEAYEAWQKSHPL